MGWPPVLAEIFQLEQNGYYQHFLQAGWEETKWGVERFLDWQVDHIDDCAIFYACEISLRGI